MGSFRDFFSIWYKSASLWIPGPFMAALIEVLGFKKMMIYAMATLLLGVLSTFFMEHARQLILIWGFIIGLGSGLFLTVLSPYVANRWFVKRRGLAIGILTASTATGQLLLFPLLAIIIENFSWRWAMGLILIISFIMLVVILLFIKILQRKLVYFHMENCWTQ
jgi:MFS family permease